MSSFKAILDLSPCTIKSLLTYRDMVQVDGVYQYIPVVLSATFYLGSESWGKNNGGPS